MLCGAGGVTSVTSASSWACLCRSSTKARSTRMPSTTPSWDGPGVPRVKPMARQPSSTSASRTRSSVAGSAHVVDAGDLIALVDPALVGGVRLHGAVPVEVVGGEVEDGRGVGAQARAPSAAGSWTARRRARRTARRPRTDVDQRGADVADGGGAQTGGAQDRGEHPDGGGLAVGAGDGEPGRARLCPPSRPRSRQASSTSPHTGTPAVGGRREERARPASSRAR